MNEVKTTERDKRIKKFKRLVGISFTASLSGEWDKGLKVIKQGEELIKSFHGDLPKELEEPYCLLLHTKFDIIFNRGYLARGFEIANELLTIAEKYGITKYVAISFWKIGEFYYRSGDFDKALVYHDRGIMLKEESDDKDPFSLTTRVVMHSDAMVVAIDKGNLELAKKYFTRLEEICKQNPGDHFLIPQYKFNKALFLQLSNRSRDRVKAEELFKEVIEDGFVISFHKILSHVGLCELLLVELKMTGEMEVINEFGPLLKKLIDLAQKWESDLYLMEAYILQSKLALLTFDIKSARRVLIQAQRIAERHGFRGVADEIARLHDDLNGKLDKWKNLEETNAPLSERIELAGLDDHVKGKFRRKIMKIERVDEKEVTVYKELQSCLVCKGSAGGFNIYVCPTCKSIYCKACAKAVIGIENACWTCENPIDASKTVKLYRPEQEDIKVDKKKPNNYK